MNEMNETQLRAWRPRRPAAGLKHRIFRAGPAAPATAWNWNRLAPAAACALVAMLALHFNGGGALGQKPVMTLTGSGQNGASDAGNDGQTMQNQLAAVTFDWTNHSDFNSSMGFTPMTNLSK
jgi:hypothetical protein